MKYNSNRGKNFYRDYKIKQMKSPVDRSTYVYVYHYKIGFSATFKDTADAMYWMEGIPKNSYSRLF